MHSAEGFLIQGFEKHSASSERGLVLAQQRVKVSRLTRFAKVDKSKTRNHQREQEDLQLQAAFKMLR